MSDSRDELKHPMQPIGKDDCGIHRFKENGIVRYLLDSHPSCDLNKLASMPHFGVEDYVQFAQLLGYSVSGFGELSYVPDEDRAAADARSALLAEKGFIEETEEQTRLRVLRDLVRTLKEGLREPVAELYGIDPDELMEVSDA